MSQKSTLISGGAVGADQLFEQLAVRNGHSVRVYKSGDTEGVEIYDKFLVYLNGKYLQRQYPTRNEYTNGLLRRDVRVGIEADSMFAVGTLDEKYKINGGTAWASYTFINKFLSDGAFKGVVPFYFYDQNKCVWYQVYVDSNSINYIIVDNPKIPVGSKYAGIGTRELNDNGVNAIKNLYI